MKFLNTRFRDEGAFTRPFGRAPHRQWRSSVRSRSSPPKNLQVFGLQVLIISAHLPVRSERQCMPSGLRQQSEANRKCERISRQTNESKLRLRPSPPYNERLRIQGSQSFFAVYKIVSVQKNTSASVRHNRLMQSVLKIRRL